MGEHRTATASRRAANADDVLPVVIFLLSLWVYSYIFQGIGWNQMSHFATIRSIVERGTADITALGGGTGDVMVLHKRLFSNKPPGLALAGVPAYWVLFHVERWLGFDPGAEVVWRHNLHVLTILLCALPAALINVLIYLACRREEASPRCSMLLAGGFAFGSLSLPYSGLFMSHLLCALLIFAAWYLLTCPTLTTRNTLLAGALLGYSAFSDLFTGCAAVCLAGCLLYQHANLRTWLAYMAGPIAAGIALFAYDRLVYGSGTQISQLGPSQFSHSGLFMGQFGWPDVRRIYWITYQPMRGLLACCPEFVLCLVGPLVLMWDRKMRWRPELLCILPMLAAYLVFYMTFYGWSGGYSVGPRYLIPILPLLWIFAIKPSRRWPSIAAIAIALSIIYMLAITSVCAVDPELDTAPPTRNDPVGADLILFLHGRVTDAWMSETIGGMLGLPKGVLIFPFILPVFLYFCLALAAPSIASRPQSSITR